MMEPWEYRELISVKGFGIDRAMFRWNPRRLCFGGSGGSGKRIIWLGLAIRIPGIFPIYLPWKEECFVFLRGTRLKKNGVGAVCQKRHQHQKNWLTVN